MYFDFRNRIGLLLLMLLLLGPQLGGNVLETGDVIHAGLADNTDVHLIPIPSPRRHGRLTLVHRVQMSQEAAQRDVVDIRLDEFPSAAGRLPQDLRRRNGRRDVFFAASLLLLSWTHEVRQQ